MKSTLTILLAAAAVTLSAVYAVQRRDSAGQRARIVSLQGELDQRAQQTEALLSIMKEERKDVAAAAGLPAGDADKDPAKLQVLLSEDKMDELLQVQQTIGQHVYENARTILSPDQLDAFGRFQTNQMRMMPAFMNMTRKMFAPSPSPADAAPPTQ
jgi:hypothetical protein